MIPLARVAKKMSKNWSSMCVGYTFLPKRLIIRAIRALENPFVPSLKELTASSERPHRKPKREAENGLSPSENQTTQTKSRSGLIPQTIKRSEKEVWKVKQSNTTKATKSLFIERSPSPPSAS
jgi:hypothetical protein